jgi:hypothetical protein
MAIAEQGDNIRGAKDASTRAPRTRVRSWTGRSAMSFCTDSHVPTFVTAGTFRTRVSEMRLSGRTRLARLSAGAAGSEPIPSQRRSRGGSPRPFGRSG